MQTFKLDDQYTIVCDSQSTRSGFRHVAFLIRNGNEIDRAKVTYLNRTWESYPFESVIMKLINNHFKGAELEEMKQKAKRFG